ncbi:tRNA pseudouridine(55) synthase TruB [Desulfonema ishimotonii]|uniref:tRNA pseudouridine synthase B n=1 Tax=Desulfonema ishimotonii TaxID=45657 RepID=A0A401G407_9BACT|nr:tRNA pseudouridine(55) synthase TruB [Desulfonema ishimotonii]GBC63921.1 tRNA pseudouridine(55) synthase TruB [Desulfonema ishimotonii]
MQSPLNGILIIDKPEEMSSARALACVKKATGVRKAGHTGTLDPFATGVLVCCVNQATKLSRFFLHGDKSYEATLLLGVETDTQDLTGSVLSTCENLCFSDEEVRAAFAPFEGRIEQQPPVYSALKHNGVPLYKLARQGKPVQKPPRTVLISRLEILEIALPEVRFAVSCSGGTYIRTLAADIGRALGCGAHLKALRRTGSSHFALKDAVTLAELGDLAAAGRIGDRLVSLSDALTHMPDHQADHRLMRKIMYGNTIARSDIPANLPEGYLRVTDSANRLLAVLSHKKESDTYNYCCVFNSNVNI